MGLGRAMDVLLRLVLFWVLAFFERFANGRKSVRLREFICLGEVGAASNYNCLIILFLILGAAHLVLLL